VEFFARCLALAHAGKLQAGHRVDDLMLLHFASLLPSLTQIVVTSTACGRLAPEL
jgi:hypothetical protein